ncbi:MAG: serine hydrolase domain-containing protein [Candidatus Limnocylindrales bacterium]
MTDLARQASIEPLDIDLGPARAAAARWVANEAIPCAAIGVVDARGAIRCDFVPGREGSLDLRTVFFLASLTKGIVATAVMRYVDEGRLDLDTPIARYLPQMAGTDAGAVTARQVLTHTSGLPDMPIESLRNERPTYERSVRWLRGSHRLNAPGAAYRYNSVSFVLLAEVMATLSQAPFDVALARRLTEPLGMVDTTFDARGLRDRVVPVHGIGADNRLIREVLVRFLAAARMPGGGMFGTLADLLRLGRALLPADPAETGPRVLSQGAIDEMTRNHTEGWTHVSEDGVEREVRQGLGWRVPQRQWSGSPRAFTHGGISGGRLWVEPEAGFAVAFLTNRWQAPIEVSLSVIDEVYHVWP